jgi:hypothetical protein
MLLIKFSNNWADEFYVEGFAVWSASKWEAHKVSAAKLFDGENRYGQISISVGSNQEIAFDDLHDYLDSFSVIELSDVEYAAFKHLFREERRGIIEYGMFRSLEDQFDQLDEEGE